MSLQEMYGLNHEVLYMAVKLIDLYLMKNETLQNKFQLLASGALLLATKVDVNKNNFLILTNYFIIINSLCFWIGERGAWFPLRPSQT